MSEISVPMMGPAAALEYAETMIPDMIGEIDEITSLEYEKFVNRIRYMCRKDKGVIPMYIKGKHIHSYWTCGNCGSIINDVSAKYCSRCGYFLTVRFPNYSNGSSVGK